MSENDNSEREQDKGAHGQDPSERPHVVKVREFLGRMKDIRERRRLARIFKAIPEGDWEALRNAAEAEGLSVTVEELKEALPKAFYKGEGKDPNLFWKRA